MNDFTKSKWKVIQHWGDFLDGINGYIYHYKDVPISEPVELESSHPWEKSDIVCCERCKNLFDL